MRSNNIWMRVMWARLKVLGDFFAFQMHEKSHHVERLAVHLKGGETIVFASGQETEAIAADSTTTLTAWFALNKEEPDGKLPPARSLHYTEVPEHFAWNKKRSGSGAVDNALP